MASAAGPEVAGPAGELMTLSEPQETSSLLEEEDLYRKLKKLERQIEFLGLQENFVREDSKNLKIEMMRAQEEVKRIQSVPLVIGQFLEPIDQHTGTFSHPELNSRSSLLLLLLCSLAIASALLICP